MFKYLHYVQYKKIHEHIKKRMNIKKVHYIKSSLR